MIWLFIASTAGALATWYFAMEGLRLRREARLLKSEALTLRIEAEQDRSRAAIALAIACSMQGRGEVVRGKAYPA